MRSFNFSEVAALVAQEGLTGEEARVLYWMKFCEYLMESNCDSVTIGLIDRIDKKCDGFRDFAFRNATIEMSTSLTARRIMKRRRNLRRKYDRAIKEVATSGILSPEYEEYFRKNQALQRQLYKLRHERPWKVFLVLTDKVRVQVIYK